MNDFNTRTYAHMNHILDVLDRTKVDGRHPFRVARTNLLDTTCWYTPRQAEGAPVNYTGDDTAPAPDRKYFVNGASDWSYRLAGYLAWRGGGWTSASAARFPWMAAGRAPV